MSSGESMDLYKREVSRGARFEFGKNWDRFLQDINEERIKAAETSLKRMLCENDLCGKSFLDIGSGSGLFSLAARRLGARVHSFDYDPHSVACTEELKRRYFLGDLNWTVEEGSALDINYLESLGIFDIIYCWGVLHHTGQMWQAMENILLPAGPTSRLFIAIYNDVGTKSSRWGIIKRAYNGLPKPLRLPFATAVMLPGEVKSVLSALLTLRIGEYARSWRQSDSERGMSRWHDLIDWVGGYPYEVAKPEEVFDFYRARGFTLLKMKCGGVGLGCNQFVFINESSYSSIRHAQSVGSTSNGSWHEQILRSRT
jgi:2-polyprenyl-6-hydroxyphenyl methylase/3-demethylubiquinone-9 3-methyltransferase